MRQTIVFENVAAVIGSMNADPWVMLCREVPDPQDIDFAIEQLQIWRKGCTRYHDHGSARRRDWKSNYKPEETI